MLFNPPKRIVWKKTHEISIDRLDFRAHKVAFGSYGLKATEKGYLTGRQIEAARRAIIKPVKKKGKLYIRIFPDLALTRKPIQVRMGKGKGTPEVWVAPIKAGKVLFELEGVSEDEAFKAFRLGGHKLPIRTRVVK